MHSNQASRISRGLSFGRLLSGDYPYDSFVSVSASAGVMNMADPRTRVEMFLELVVLDPTSAHEQDDGVEGFVMVRVQVMEVRNAFGFVYLREPRQIER